MASFSTIGSRSPPPASYSPGPSSGPVAVSCSQWFVIPSPPRVTCSRRPTAYNSASSFTLSARTAAARRQTCSLPYSVQISASFGSAPSCGSLSALRDHSDRWRYSPRAPPPRVAGADC
ncbi:hypothetical protein FA95DRAFT_1564547 [Auriscalpium vulgare]|uniref:Uncharacterized protein n=1 Tax=Auriscalpium vulgare TaxID=40419 RepID=A0ACB8RF16_9AGAM|nr:hypothetical protein FA95DRAFT_1564547 [Auriscalpium vulgare]